MSNLASQTLSVADCLFCKIVKGAIPSHLIKETEKSYAFLDIGPLSKGHALVIPKYHAEFFHQLPNDSLTDILPLAKDVALAIGAKDYNILQNNGAIAHQVVKHVHFHIIPKPNEEEGLKVGWPAKQPSQDELKATLAKIKENL